MGYRGTIAAVGTDMLIIYWDDGYIGCDLVSGSDLIEVWS